MMTSQPTTSQQWASWLQAEEERSLQLYINYPERLVSDRNQERQVAGDYAGREILELLQNANDAAIEANIRGRVRVELSSVGLVIANEGAPFTTEGVASLQLANFSPKRNRKRQTVGSKGLGFRAVLNWTRTPLVFSDALVLGFSTTTALNRQQKLAAQDERLRTLIQAEQENLGSLVVPLLAFPDFHRNGESGLLIDEGPQRILYNRAQKLRSDGFTTVIAMPFDDGDQGFAQAVEQLAQLRPEVLLFARNINRLEIAQAGQPETSWRHQLSDGDVSVVHIGPDKWREWTVFRKSDAVPASFVSPDRPAGMDYEVIVAVPQNHEPIDRVLYSYFPTETSFPYPIVAHATLDLQANRQHPQGTAANCFIFSELASLMAGVAEKVATEKNDQSGLKLLASDTWFDPLEKFKFRDLLCAAAKKRNLVPTIGGDLVKPTDAKLTTFTDTSWLPKRYFRDVARIDEDILLRVLQWLDVPELSSDNLTGASIEFETMDERADYIAGIIKHKIALVERHNALLVDNKQRTVPAGYRVFVGGSADVAFELPDWFQARFLHDELRAALWKRLRPDKQEKFIAQLLPLGVMAYSRGGVIEGLVARARQRIENSPDREHDIRRELVQALYSMFPASESRDLRQQFPNATRVLVATIAGSFEDARKVYLSSDYGPKGRILEDLYHSFPAKLLATPGLNGLEGSGENLAEFFVWLGVADAPVQARIPADKIERDFNKYARFSLTYPLRIEDYHFTDPQFSSSCSEVASMDALEEILNTAPPAAILAWLSSDRRAQEWKIHSRAHGRLSCKRTGDRNVRHYDDGIPSYVRWKLQSTRWLPTRDGQVAAPRDCLVEPVQAITKLLPIPAWLSVEQMRRYGVHASSRTIAFDNAGVLPGFSQIRPEELYELLISLPDRNPTGDLAKTLYQAVLDHFVDAEALECSARDRFFQKGQILARCEDKLRYSDISSAWHLNTDDLPQGLRRRLNIAELPKSARAQRVHKLFGVKTIGRAQIVRRIHTTTPHADAAEASEKITKLKPLIGYLRRTQTQRYREQAAFNEVTINLCSAIDGDVEFQGETVPLDLKAWSWMFDNQNRTAYLLADPSDPEPLESALFATSVGEIFADVFGLERGTEFAQLAQCPYRDQLALLKRLVGEETVPGLAELERSHQEDLARDSELVKIPEYEPQSPVPGAVTQPVGEEPDGLPSPPDDIPPSDPNRPLTIRSEPHSPQKSSGIVALRISRRPSLGPRTTQHERVSGDFCEEKVMEFELHSDPPRYPLHVAGITGWSSPGVDILSFDSPEERAAFLAAETKQASMVSRFIEVKGRRDKGAKIDLRDNELSAARRFGRKYYLYRVYDQGNGSYGVAILKDPLSDLTGRKRFYEVNLDAATRTEQFELSAGLTKDAYIRGSRVDPITRENLSTR
jgi:hypothetical protein